MKLGLISAATPLGRGSDRRIVDALAGTLRAHGHDVETIYLPATDNPSDILQQMAAFRLIRIVDRFDRIITCWAPAQMVRHPCKVIWFTPPLHRFSEPAETTAPVAAEHAAGQMLRAAITAANTTALREAHRVFTPSRLVSDRLCHCNGIDSAVLYPPLPQPDSFRCGPHGEEIVAICRLAPSRRQHLLIEAMQYVRTGVRLRLCGPGDHAPYLAHLRERIASLALGDRVTLEPHWITEAAKVSLLATALASAYLPDDQDFYGYPTLEAAQAERCTITLTDAAGPAEFVQHDVSGLLVEPDPRALAQVFDGLYTDRPRAARLGQAARQRIAGMGINWDSVTAELLS